MVVSRNKIFSTFGSPVSLLISLLKNFDIISFINILYSNFVISLVQCTQGFQYKGSEDLKYPEIFYMPNIFYIFPDANLKMA